MSIHVRFVVEKVALGQGFLQILRLAAVNIFPPMIDSNFHLYVCAVTSRKNEQSLGIV